LVLGVASVEGVYVDTASGDSGDQIAEVIVTATKRETTVQTTAASITAVSAADIAARGWWTGAAAGAGGPGLRHHGQRRLHGCEVHGGQRHHGISGGVCGPRHTEGNGIGELRWKHDVTDKVSLSSTLDGNYIGTRTDAPYGETITLTNINSYLIHLPAYGLVNFRFGAFGDNSTATAFCNNLFNKEALLDPQPQINLQMAAFARYIVNQPRTVGIDLTYSSAEA
jgi:hypothetical protein